MATDLPNWVYDVVMALQAWENDHPMLFQQMPMPDDSFVRTDACGCEALKVVPNDVKATATVLANYQRRAESRAVFDQLPWPKCSCPDPSCPVHGHAAGEGGGA